MTLFKAHGLGNDYLVWMGEQRLDPARAVALCDRHRGPGGDGVLEPTPTDRADYGVTIWNPDGSVAEKSGNGLRIHAWWLSTFQDAGTDFTIDTGHDVVRCVVDGLQVTVEMGTAVFREDLTSVGIEGQSLPCVAVSVGNPHCVCFREEAELDALPWRTWGPAIENHPAFVNRTNVQFAKVIDGDVHIRIWERGAGETSASGSSSCAAAAAAVHTGQLAPGPIEVRMPGGTLHVTISPDYRVTLRGPVAPVGTIRLDPRFQGGT